MAGRQRRQSQASQPCPKCGSHWRVRVEEGVACGVCGARLAYLDGDKLRLLVPAGAALPSLWPSQRERRREETD